MPAAVRATLELYGSELYGFLIGVVDDAELAALVYSDVCRGMTGQITAFDWRCSLRAWTYGLARRELRDRRSRLKWTLDGASEEGGVTRAGRQAGAEGAIAAIRRALSEEERELLILRVDRRFDWEELAITELGDHGSLLAVGGEARRLAERVKQLIERLERAAAHHAVRR